MKNIFKILSLLIVIGAVVGAVILVQKNQETRRGATVAESSLTMLPSTVTVKNVNDKQTIQLWVNTGSGSDILSAVELKIAYAKDRLKFVNYDPNNGFEVLNENIDDKNGVLTLKLVKLSVGKSGAINVGNIKFKVTKQGDARVSFMSDSKIMVSGQSNLWSAGSTSGSVISVPMPVIVDPEVEPPVVLPSREPRPRTGGGESAGKEGDFCGGRQNIQCEDGLICVKSNGDKDLISVPEGAGVCKSSGNVDDEVINTRR